MVIQYLKRNELLSHVKIQEGTLNVYHCMKEASPKRPYIMIRVIRHTRRGKTMETVKRPVATRESGAGKDARVEHRGLSGQWSYLHDTTGDTAIVHCPNSQNAQEQ